jgi:hypothetical protein
MADDPSQDGEAPAEGAAAAGTQRLEAGDAEPGAPGDETAPRQLRRRPNLRGHIVVDDDEPLPVFDTPPDPPPVPPPARGSQAMRD